MRPPKKNTARAAGFIARIVGMHFHTYKNNELDCQGEVLDGDPTTGMLRVAFFSFIDGGESHQELVPIERACAWRFYANSDAMKAAYELYNISRGRR